MFARSFSKLAPLAPSIRFRAPIHHIIPSASTRHFSDSPKPVNDSELRSEKDLIFDMAKIFEVPE